MARRGRGEGSIFYRPDENRWVAVLDLGRVNGRRRRRYLTGPTQRAVRDKLLTARRAQADGLPPGDGRLTVAGFLRSWLEDSAQPRLRPRTYHS